MNFKLNNLMKQAQEMQKKMKKMQDEVESLEESGEAGGGAVSITLTGKRRVKRVKLDPSILQESCEVIEDLIAAAFNMTIQKIDDASSQKMASITAGLDLPEEFK